jgi:hypothetical protein
MHLRLHQLVVTVLHLLDFGQGEAISYSAQPDPGVSGMATMPPRQWCAVRRT